MLVNCCDRRPIELLQDINVGRQQERQAGNLQQAEAIVDELFQASSRLAVYGTLAPGEENEWVLNPLQGEWRDGVVRGDFFPPGSWGNGIDYPGFRWDPNGGPVAVRIFESEKLAGEWKRLDEFEGEEYQRILVIVESASGTAQVANLYSIRVQ